MKIHKILRLLQKSWFTDTYTKIVKNYFKSYNFLLFKYRKEFQENKEIYEMNRSIFRFVWEHAKPMR